MEALETPISPPRFVEIETANAEIKKRLLEELESQQEDDEEDVIHLILHHLG